MVHETAARAVPFVVLACVLTGLAGCYQFNNPVDPGSPDYQGGSTEPGWLDGWTYRKQFRVENGSSQSLNEHAVRIDLFWGQGTDAGRAVYLGGGAETDFSDLRFTDSDGQTVLSWWVQEQTDGTDAVAWIKVPHTAASDSVDLCLYYGNTEASSTSSGAATFPLFDHFEAGGIDNGMWMGHLKPSDPNGWWIDGGSARCENDGKLLYCQTDFVDAEVLASVSLGSMTNGFLVLRGDALSTPDPLGDRYDLYFDKTNGGVAVRGVTSSLGSPIMGVSHVSASGFFDTSFRVVGPGPSGNSLAARVEDSGGSYTTLSVDDPTYFQGRIGFGTQTANSGSMLVDWIAVRPAVDPEPTVGGWQAEEVEP